MEVYQLSKEQAKLGYPVDLEATVTYGDAEWGMLFIQDGESRAFIATSDKKTNYPSGSVVRVTGVTTVRDNWIQVGNPAVKYLRSGIIIKPQFKLLKELDSGDEDSSLVVTEGVLHPCVGESNHSCFWLVGGGKQVLLRIREVPSIDLDRLVGATVRARGVCASHMDTSSGKRMGAQILLESHKQIDMEMPAVTMDSASVPVRNVHWEEADLPLVQRVHLRGRVSWGSQSFFTLQDETGTIFIRTFTPVSIHIGDSVDIVGFPFHGLFGLELRDSYLRLTSASPTSVAKIVAMNTSIREIRKKSINLHLVQMVAQVEKEEDSPGQTVFHLRNHGDSFSAVLLTEDSRKYASLPRNTTVQLTGLELLQNQGKSEPLGVLLLIGLPSDIVLRPSENWLTWQRALAILGFVAICLLIPLAWVKQLKRTVRKQMAINNEQMEKELRLATKYQRLFERNLAAVYSLRPDGVITECNPAFLKLLGLDEMDQLQGRSYWEFEIESDRQEDLKDGCQVEMLSNSQATLCRDDGSIVYLLKNVSPVETPEGMIYEITAIDVTQMRRHQVELQHSRDTAVIKSLIDPLTELPNRRNLMESLPAMLENAKQGGNSSALLFIDLDGFKPVNDNLGHAAGDEVLIHIANTMRSLVRKGDSLARLGGDEFMLVLCDLGASDDAVRVAEGLLRAIDKPISVLDQKVHVTASIGISIFPADATQAEELIERADRAMYAAKRQGRNRFLFYSGKMEEAAAEEQDQTLPS